MTMAIRISLIQNDLISVDIESPTSQGEKGNTFQDSSRRVVS
jgi:hypothetical protein